MEPTYVHGRCAPWHIGTGNRRQICDFETQPPPHDLIPRWAQEKPPVFLSTCQDSQPSTRPGHKFAAQQQPVQILFYTPAEAPPQPQLHLPRVHAGPSPLNAMQQQQKQQQRGACDPGMRQELRQQRLFGDEMLMSDFRGMEGMERRFYIPPEFRGPEQSPWQVKSVARASPQVQSDKRECRSMCMPKGMGAIDPNCQGVDYRVNSGYQPSRPGDAVDRRFDPCCKWKPFRDGTSEGHKAAHWQFGKDRETKPGRDKKNKDCARDPHECPENQTTIGNRSVYPKLGGMVPGYGGHVPGFERCKFGKTYGRETAEVLKKVKSTNKIPRSYSMAEWRTKCYNKEVNC